MSTVPSGQAASFQRTIGPIQFAIFGFGSIIGTSWVVLLGGWLLHAGPGGAILGIILAGAAMALIAAMYAELGSRFPQTGGEVTYINAVFGKTFGFIVGWFLSLAYLSFLIFEGIALSWLLGILWPPIMGPIQYVIFGEPIRLGGLVFALLSCLIIAFMNYRGARLFVRFQTVMTTIFILVVAVTMGFEFYFGSVSNLRPVWRAGNGGFWLIGAAWVFGFAPMMYNSFQAVLHAIEERSHATSKEVVVRLCIVAVASAALFYMLVVIAAATATPWTPLASSNLPAVDAIAHLPGSKALTTALLLALIASLLKTWGSVFLMTVRFLFAQARDGMIPASFGSVNPGTGAPGKAVIAVAVLNFAGIFLGKGLLVPLMNAISVCIALVYVLICAAALMMRKRDPGHVGFRVPGGYPVGILAAASALAMGVFALLQPAETSQAGAFKWTLLVSWSLLGLGLYFMRNRRPRSTDTRLQAS
jgi:APA family basic amino acid/polyamine antiporter